ncbi:MAG TPA: PAS domain S-box protein [Azospira sp.]|nr:PAS domain S-box protein [Azospira sp.]
MNSAERKQRTLRIRAAAEARLASDPVAAGAGRPVEYLLHELQVHQIELEMQNETLRQAQISLEEARDRYQSLYEQAPVGYLTLNADGLITEINRTGAEFLGMDKKQLLKRSFTSFVSHPDQERWVRHSLGCAQQEGPSTLELTLRRGDDTLLHAQLNCVSQQAGSAGPLIRLTLTDITQRRQAHNERRHNLRRIESLMRHANDCILMFDAETRIIDVSDSCLGIYGYSREEMLNKRLAELRAPDQCGEIPRLFRQLLEQTSLSYQTWHRRADGSRFPVQIGATMIDIDGNRYFQKIARDISETVRQRTVMESGLAAASRHLLELSRHLVEAQEDARRRLSGELHDHTSPNLAAIKINLGMVAAALPAGASAEFGERLADTVALVEDTDASIRDICADLRSPVLDYAGLTAAMEEYALRYANRTGIAVTVHADQGGTRLAPAIESLLFRIFQEALTNSLKHAHASTIDVNIALASNPVALSIADNGVGFDVDRAGAGVGGGMGLLNMREMAEFAGGHVDIDSHPGAGTRIEVRLNA